LHTLQKFETNIIRAVKSNLFYDVIKIFVNDTNGILIELYNKERDETKKSLIPAVPIMLNNSGIKSIDYSHEIKISPVNFSKYLKDLNNSCDKVKFIINHNDVYISGLNDTKTTTTYHLKNNKTLSILALDDAEQINKIIDIKFIIILNKCVNLSNNVSLYFANNQPITAAYKLSSLGELKLVLF
jgi:hypothetical protein